MHFLNVSKHMTYSFGVVSANRPWFLRKSPAIFLLSVLLASSVPIWGAESESLTIAAAADVAACLDEVNAAFLVVHPTVRIAAVLGSSGTICAQIANGAPYEVFLSADVAYPTSLIDTGCAERDSLTPYGIGRLVWWTTMPGLDVTRGFALCDDPLVTHVVIANPSHAPYGAAAQAALEHAGRWQSVQSRLVFGDNVAQAVQFVQSGNAQVGIVAMSQVVAPRLQGVGWWWEIPADTYPVLQQAAVLTKKGAAKPIARAYITFLSSPEARVIFNRFGFRLPDVQP